MTTATLPTIAIVGATGAVGEVALELVAKHFGPKVKVHALASETSVGREVSFGRRSVVVDDVAGFDFKGCDFALFSAGRDVSLHYAPIAAQAGAVVIDNTSAFRLDPDVPLVVPEVNGHLLDSFEGSVIANPNCSTIQMCVALAPIYRHFGLGSVVVSTYQSVSGAGRLAMEELGRQAMDRFNFKEPKPSVFAQPIGFNVLAQIGAFDEAGFSEEEVKMHHETQRIFDDPAMVVNATAVRVPVFVGHALSVWVETRQPFDLDEVRQMLNKAPGVMLTAPEEVASPLSHAQNQDAVWVSRLRRAHASGGQEGAGPNSGLMMWVVADNLRKGAALNALQIMQRLISARASG